MDHPPPATPVRSKNAYPSDLSRGDADPGTQRVPLHRRGTSRQFERLEDLLREAGFKETRVFAPENERAERREAVQRDARKRLEEQLHAGGKESRRGHGGIVGFLSGFVPSWSNAAGSAQKQHLKTQSLGRATGKQATRMLNDDDEDEDQGTEDRPTTPTPAHQRLPIITTSDFSSPGSSSSSSSRSPPIFQQKLKPLAQQGAFTSRGARHAARPRPDARSTLRHMISAPDFAGQQRSGEARRVTTAAIAAEQSKYSARSGDRASTVRAKSRNDQPPLPQNWLSTVANAVMGTSGVHVGGPPRGRPRILTPGLETHRRSRTVTNVTVESTTKHMHDTTDTRSGSLVRHGFAPRTPIVETTPGLVTPASVVCRSAPGSRSTSLARQSSASGGARRKLTRPQRHRHSDESCVPCLGVTCVELIESKADDETFEHCTCDDRTRSRLPTSQSIGAKNGADDYQYEESDMDSEDGELDFARLIVPARRQHSIHSLRRHLHNHTAAASSAGTPYVHTLSPPSAYNQSSKPGLTPSLSRTSLRHNQQQRSQQRQKTTSRTHSGRSLSRADSSLNVPPLSAAISSGGVLDPEADPELDGMVPRRSRSGYVGTAGSRAQKSGDVDGEDEDEVRKWTERGLPGLEGAVNKKRGALPLPWGR